MRVKNKKTHHDECQRKLVLDDGPATATFGPHTHEPAGTRLSPYPPLQGRQTMDLPSAATDWEFL